MGAEAPVSAQRLGDRKGVGLTDDEAVVPLTHEVDPDGVTAEDARRLSRDDHRRAFTAFCTMLMADFDRYLATPEADIVEDGVGFTQAALWLTDDELAELRSELAAAVTSRTANARRGTRKKYL